MRDGSFNILNFLMKLKSPLKYACLHLTFLPRAGPLPMNKRKGLANYHRQSRTAAEPSWEEFWEEFPSLSQAGTVLGQGGWAVAKSFCSHCLTQWITWVGGGRRGIALCMGSSSTERTSGWEELLQLPVLYQRLKLSEPLHHSSSHSDQNIRSVVPGVAGGTTAASWDNGLVGREGVVPLCGPLTADSQEVLAELGNGRSRSRIPPLPALAGPPSLTEALQYLPIEQWSGYKSAKTPKEILWTTMTVFKMFCHRLSQEAVF